MNVFIQTSTFQQQVNTFDNQATFQQYGININKTAF